MNGLKPLMGVLTPYIAWGLLGLAAILFAYVALRLIFVFLFAVFCLVTYTYYTVKRRVFGR